LVSDVRLAWSLIHETPPRASASGNSISAVQGACHCENTEFLGLFRFFCKQQKLSKSKDAGKNFSVMGKDYGCSAISQTSYHFVSTTLYR